MKRTNAAQTIIQPLWPGPEPGILVFTFAPFASDPRAALFMYASRSLTRCSSVTPLAAGEALAVTAGVNSSACANLKKVRERRIAKKKMMKAREILGGFNP